MRVQVTLTDKGVRILPRRLRPTQNTTLAVRVVNRSAVRRWFKLGWRKTRPIQRGGSYDFYFGFYAPGRVAWRAGGADGKSFRGGFEVAAGFSNYGG